MSNRRATETIIVGAGIVGCSVAYHLAKIGYKDVLVLDRGRLSDPLGSTGHAPGLLGRLSSSSAMTAFANYTANLFIELPNDNPAFTQVGGLEVTRHEGRVEDLRQKVRVAAAHGIDARLVSPDELGELIPYMNTAPLAGGVFMPGDGAIDALRALRVLHDEASSLGVVFREETIVTGFERAGNQITGVRTNDGLISCRSVVVCVGIWARRLMESLGIYFPLIAVQHPYVRTASLNILEGQTRKATRPLVRDVDHSLYMREHGDQLGFGWYNHKPMTVNPETLEKAEIAFPERGSFGLQRRCTSRMRQELADYWPINCWTATRRRTELNLGPVASAPRIAMPTVSVRLNSTISTTTGRPSRKRFENALSSDLGLGGCLCQFR